MIPTFDANAISRLAERTEYEAWFLEAVYAIAEQKLFRTYPDAVLYPIDGSKPQFIAYMTGEMHLGDWRSGFLEAGAPLVFVTAFKLLDMFLEWVLAENGVPSTFRFEEKLRHLAGPHSFPPVIEDKPWLKARLIRLYETLEPLRGTIIHSRHFVATNGSIEVSSSKRGVIGNPVAICASDLRNLAVMLVSVLRYVDATWAMNDLREKFLRHAFDGLTPLHGLSILGQKRPYHAGVRVYVANTNPLTVDALAIWRDLATQYQDQDCSFDLRVIVVRDGVADSAYLFPWHLIVDGSFGSNSAIDAQSYRSNLPNDINPDHLRVG